MLERLVLKSPIQPTSQHIQQISAARVVVWFGRSLGRSIARSLDHSIAQSPYRLVPRLGAIVLPSRMQWTLSGQLRFMTVDIRQNCSTTRTPIALAGTSSQTLVSCFVVNPRWLAHERFPEGLPITNGQSTPLPISVATFIFGAQLFGFSSMLDFLLCFVGNICVFCFCRALRAALLCAILLFAICVGFLKSQFAILWKPCGRVKQHYLGRFLHH